MLALIGDTPDADLEDSAQEPTEPPANKPTQPAEDTDSAKPAPIGPDFLRDYLRELQWSESDIARLLVGPALSHHTAEGLYRQHAANTPQDQALLLEALRRAGAAKVPRDPSLLSGLNPNHLLPEQPADLAQIVSQFAELPDVQKRRFLALLDKQPPSKAIRAADSARPRGANPGPGKPAQKAAPSPSAPAGKKEPSAKAEDVLTTVLKGSFDTLGTLIKGLLGDGRSGKGLPSPKGSTPPDKKAPPASEDEPVTPSGDEPSDSSSKKDRPNPRSPAESDDSGGSDSSDSDSNSNDSPDSDSNDSDSNDTPYGPPAPEELPADLGGDREPD